MMRNPLWILVVLLVASLGTRGEIFRLDTARLVYSPGQSCRPPQQSRPSGKTLETCRFFDEAESLEMVGEGKTGGLERIFYSHSESDIHRQAKRGQLGENANTTLLFGFDKGLAWLGLISGLIFLALAGRLGYGLLKARHKPGDTLSALRDPAKRPVKYYGQYQELARGFGKNPQKREEQMQIIKGWKKPAEALTDLAKR